MQYYLFFYHKIEEVLMNDLVKIIPKTTWVLNVAYKNI